MGFGGRSGIPGSGSGPASNVDITAIGGVAVTAQPKTDGQSNAMSVLEVGAREEFYNGVSWDPGRSGFVGVVATYVGFQNQLPYGVHNAAAPVLADGSGAPLQLDASGALIVTTAGGSFSPASVGVVGAAAPASADQAGFVDAAGTLRGARTYDTDSGAGVENTLGVVLRSSANGGSLELGTVANPLVTLVANNLSTTADQGASNGDPTDGWSVQLTDGTNFYTAANPVPTVNSPNATSDSTAALGTNFGTDGSISIKGSAGNVFSASVSHDGTTKRYIQLFDKAAPPANGDTPLLVFVLPPATATVDSMTLIGTDFFGTEGTHFSTGIAIGVSSTKNTFTEDGTSEKAIQVKYK